MITRVSRQPTASINRLPTGFATAATTLANAAAMPTARPLRLVNQLFTSSGTGR
jgi:hypothetical protein